MRQKSFFLVIVITLIAILVVWLFSLNTKYNENLNQVPESVTEVQTPYWLENDDTIELTISDANPKLGDTILATWDTSKIPQGAQGLGLHILDANDPTVHTSDYGGRDPFTGQFELEIPDYEFRGYSEDAEYYVVAFITTERDPNSEIVAIGYESIKIKRQ